MADVLDLLSLSDEERMLLKASGVRTALGLARMIRAVRDDFRRNIGDDARAEAIERDVLALLTPEQLEQLAKPVPQFEMGARLTPRKD